MKIIQKTIRKAFQNWSPCKSVRCYHYSGCFDGTKLIAFTQNNPVKTHTGAYRIKLIAFTQNNPVKTHTGAYRIGEDFNLPKYKEFPYYHSESRLISQLLDRYNTIDSNWSVVVMRINRRGLILGSKPCENCSKLLEAVGLNDIFYSTDSGDFCDSFGDLVFNGGLTFQESLV